MQKIDIERINQTYKDFGVQNRQYHYSELFYQVFSVIGKFGVSKLTVRFQ